MKKNAINRKMECKTSVYLSPGLRELVAEEQEKLGLRSKSKTYEHIISEYFKLRAGA